MDGEASGERGAVRRAIVVGASSGIGEALVRVLAGAGWRVGAVARRGERLEALAAAGGPGAVFPRVHDIADAAAAAAVFEELVRALGGLDLLIYAAGILLPVAEDQFDTAVDLDMLAVNAAGCIAWGNPAAAYFRSRRAGTIVGISSVAGDRGRRGNPVYGASKAAMDHYLEALRNRLTVHGVHVCTIRPGFVDTAMTKGKEGLFWLISAEEAARRILAAVESGAQVRYVPRRWFWVGLVIRCLPSFLFRRLSV
ncbi:MAG: SDR family NAD(P)-dependent oxidoreductase [Planctomycetota bacterium]